MPATPTIRIDQLLEALKRVLDELSEQHGAEVPLADDHYWELPTRQAFDLHASPADLTIGQLSDDVEAIRRLLARPASEPIVIWHELAHICGVLRGIEHFDRPA